LKLLLWHWGRRGAGPQMLIALARALAPLAELRLSISAQSDLLAETQALGLPMDAVPTYGSALGFVTGLPRIPALRRRLVAQAQGCDAVISVMTHLWTPLLAPALAAAGIRYIPIIHDATPHPGDPAAFWGWRLKRELSAAQVAVALSESVERAVQAARPGLPTARMTLGAHLDLPPASLPAPPRPPGAPLRLLMFGRLRAYKGLDLLRDAWPLLPPGGFSLRVVGDGPAEALAPGLAAIPGVSIENRWVAEADIPALIAQTDALVLPYREASQSGVIPIAHAMGVPVVATPAGGLGEQINHGQDGLLAEAITAEALAAALTTLLAPAVLARLAAGARARGAAMADWHEQATLLLRLAASPPAQTSR
jgi:glycosyltransferase involved in cell wall biosynthesis